MAGTGAGRPRPDGKRIAFVATVPDEDPILTVKLPKKPEGAQWAKPAVIVDRLSCASNKVRSGIGSATSKRPVQVADRVTYIEYSR